MARLLAEFGTFPAASIVFAMPPGLLRIALDLTIWSEADRLPDYAGLIGLLVLACAWILAGYGASMTMLGRGLSVGGLARFASIAVLMTVLVVAAFAFFSLAMGQGLGVLGLAGLAVIVGAFVFVSLLPAWPIAAALVGRRLGPARILAATKGHRWSLIAMSFTVIGVNRLVPVIPAATGSWEAIALALSDGLICTIALMLAASTAVTALKLVLEQDHAFGRLPS